LIDFALSVRFMARCFYAMIHRLGAVLDDAWREQRCAGLLCGAAVICRKKNVLMELLAEW